MSLFSSVRPHTLGILMSCLVGLVVVAPQIAFIVSTGPAYDGLYLMQTDAEYHYLARMREVVDTGHISGNPFIFEHRFDSPSGFFSYAEAFLALPAVILPVSIADLSLIYKAVLPVLLALLIYGLVVRLGISRGWAAVASVSIVLGVTTFNLATVLAMLHQDLVYQQFIVFSRPIHPVFSSIVFVTFLHVLLSVVRHRTYRGYALLALLMGVSWYIYLYLATFLMAFVGALALLALITRKWQDLYAYIGVLVAGTVLALPALWQMFSIFGNSAFASFSDNVEVAATHMPYIHLPLLVVAALLGWFWYTHKSYKYGTFFAALLLACVVALNQQVITGIAIQSGHYVTYFCIPIYILTLVMLASHYSGKATRVLQAGIVVYAVSACAFIQYSSYVHWAPIVAEDQYLAAVLREVEQHAPKDAIVMANERLSALIPVYTSHYVMWEAHARFYLVPEERRAFTPAAAFASDDLCSYLQQFKLDYIVWDTEKDPDWQIDTKPCVAENVSIGNVRMYSVEH